MTDPRELVAKLRRLAADDAATPNEREVATRKADALEAQMFEADPELAAFRDALGALASAAGIMGSGIVDLSADMSGWRVDVVTHDDLGDVSETWVGQRGQRRRRWVFRG